MILIRDFIEMLVSMKETSWEDVSKCSIVHDVLKHAKNFRTVYFNQVNDDYDVEYCEPG